MVINTNNRFITNRNAYKQIKVKINLDEKAYSILCKYVLQDSSIVRMEHLVNLRKMLTIIDRASYQNNPEIVKRVYFIDKCLEARLSYNLTDRDMILLHANGGLEFKVDFLDYDNLTMSNDEVLWCHRMVSQVLQYYFIDNNVDNLQDILTRFKTTEYGNRGNIIEELENEIDILKNGFRQAKTESNINDVTFSLQEGVFESAVTDTYNIVTSPSRRLRTGMQGLNEMTGGGFESGRVYMFLGASGIGKSVTLLNLLYQLKIYNTKYKPKDPTKRPCVVLLTMENTVVETLTRLFDMVIDNSHGMQNYDLEEVLRLLRTQGQLNITESSPIDIVIRYKANKSVNTSYLYTLYDNLEDQGYEPICILQDHIKRIRSVDANTDIRIELGDTVNEFKVFASDKQIPVITVSHLNRDATKIIEDAARRGNQDNGKLLGKSNIGESLLMIDNIDCAIILTKDYDKFGNCYMTFNRVKMRDKGSKRSYIAQPFMPGNEIRLIEDIYGPAQFKESIHSEVFNNTSSVALTGASAMTPDEVIESIPKDDDNAFNEKKFYDPVVVNKDTDISDQMNDINNQLAGIINHQPVQPAVTPIIFRPYSPVTFSKVG
jgi:archaellum biogenesis ATPase FlaH